MITGLSLFSFVLEIQFDTSRSHLVWSYLICICPLVSLDDWRLALPSQAPGHIIRIREFYVYQCLYRPSGFRRSTLARYPRKFMVGIVFLIHTVMKFTVLSFEFVVGFRVGTLAIQDISAGFPNLHITMSVWSTSPRCIATVTPYISILPTWYYFSLPTNCTPVF